MDRDFKVEKIADKKRSVLSETEANDHFNSDQKTGIIQNKGINHASSGNSTEVAALPHEQGWAIDNQLEAEQEFQTNRQTELDIYEELLISMQENNFSDDEIEHVKNQIKALESSTYEYTEGSTDNEEITVESMREDMYESLKQNTDLSDEELKQMVKAMFPEVDSEPDNADL